MVVGERVGIVSNRAVFARRRQADYAARGQSGGCSVYRSCTESGVGFLQNVQQLGIGGVADFFQLHFNIGAIFGLPYGDCAIHEYLV